MNQKRLRHIAVFLLFCIFCAFTSKSGSKTLPHGTDILSVNAASVSYQDAIDKATAEKKVLEEKQKEIEKRLENLYRETQNMTAYIKELDDKSTALYELLDGIMVNIASCEEELAITKQELSEAEATETKQYETMKKRIKYMYENGEGNIFDIFQGTESLADILNQVEYRSRISEYDNKLLHEYMETKEQIATTKEILDLQLTSLQEQKKVQQDAVKAIEALAAVKAEELEKLCEEVGVDEEMLFLYWEEIVSMNADIDELVKLERARLAEEERIRLAEEALKKSHDISDMLWPFPASEKITSGYGYRGDIGVEGATEYHYGIDIAGAGFYGEDANIVAALAGTVVISRYSPSAGNYIRIKHDNNFYTTYMHASKLLVEEGETVERGQVIMKVGTTGASSGPHLHFEISIDGVRVDPVDYITFGK